MIRKPKKFWQNNSDNPVIVCKIIINRYYLIKKFNEQL